ncbi:MAG: hypothetical protein E4H03_06290, partial [Myxococcales bacterium]
MLRTVALLSVIAVAAVTVPLHHPDESLAASACSAAPVRTTADFTSPGPFSVGSSTFTFVDASRPTAANGEFPGAPDRTLVTEVWYPATVGGRDTPVDSSGGPYPLVVHSHGFLDSRVGELYVGEHLASHGFIVAAADYPLSNGGAPGGATVADVHNQPADASYVIDQTLALFGPDADADRIGASGLSLGGLTTHLLTFHGGLRDPRIDAALAMAGPACMFTGKFFKTTTAARLILHGNSDALVPFKNNGKRAFRGGKGRRHLVELDVGSHTGFTAFAPFFDPEVHYDAIGCAAIEGNIDSDGFVGFGGKEFGVNTSPKRCPLPCADGVPPFPSMLADRHIELTKASLLAFFEAYLRDDLAANCFIGKPMDAENA